MNIHVEMVELLAPDDREGRHFACELRMSPTGTLCQIGQHPNVDLVLPRAGYATLAQRHLGLVVDADRVARLETYQKHLLCLIDGERIEGQKVDAGEHLLVLGEHRFKLIITGCK